VLLPAAGEAEGSRGLRLVEALASRWGYERGGGGLAMTWFELGQGCSGPADLAVPDVRGAARR
jgi:hypothetical protein